MKFVIEGADKVGKTTICSKLIEVFKDRLKYKKFPSNSIRRRILDKDLSNTNKIDLLLDEMEEFLEGSNNDEHYIIDRWWISTLIYQGISKEDKDYIFDRIDKGEIGANKIKYLFYIESNVYRKTLGFKDIYESNRAFYLDKYEQFFNKEEEKLNKYFSKTIFIENKKRELEKTLSRMGDILAPEIL